MTTTCRYPATRSFLLAAAYVLGLQACGGGADSETGSDPSVACRAGIITGFKGEFNDEPILVPITQGITATGESGSVGGDGDGAGGIGAGGSLGQFTNVDVTVEFADGARAGPARVDSRTGMVTIVPCQHTAPAVVTFRGETGSGAQYFDESLGGNVPFEGRQLRSTITNFDQNVGVTSLSEAATRRTERLQATSYSPLKSLASVQQIEQAHREVLAAVNAQLPRRYRLSDLRRLPVILNESNFVSGSTVLTDDANGIYGAVLAGLVRSGAANLGPDDLSPALTINDQLVADLEDGRIDFLGPQGGVSENALPAYTTDSLWSFLTLHTTLSAQRAGVASLAQSRVPFASTVIDYDFSGTSQAQPVTRRVSVQHFSDATLRYEILDSRCTRPVVRVLNNVRQKQGLNGVTTDGRTFLSPAPASDLCNPDVEIPFNVPSGARIASLGPLGDTVLGTDGRTYSYWSGLENGPWYEIVVDGPRPVSVLYEGTVLHALTASGEVYQHSLEGNFAQDTINRTLSAVPGSGQKLPFPSSVIQIAPSGDNRENFALTADNELYWIDVRDGSGTRNPRQSPTLVRLNTGPVCWISSGIIALGCDGKSFWRLEPISDPNLPPQLDTIVAGFRFFTPGVAGIRVSGPLPVTFELWRSTNSLFKPEGAIAPFSLSSEGSLIGVDGSLRALDGNVVIQPM